MNEWLLKAKQRGPLVTALAILILMPIIALIFALILWLLGAFFLIGLDLSGFYPVETIGVLNSIGTGIVLFVLGITIRGNRSKDGN